MFIASGSAVASLTGGATSGCKRPGADDEDKLQQEDRRDNEPDRQILQEALAQLDEIDVQHHHDEQEQHRNGADINDDQDHREEFGAENEKQSLLR